MPFNMVDVGFGAWFVLAIVAAFWIGVIALILLGIRWLIQYNDANRATRPPREDAAMELLRQRFARGEIDATEFEERKRALGG
jgi:putative membrane protein